MPFTSKAQNRWAHSPTGERALGGPAKVKEWSAATDYSKLPEKKGGVLSEMARKKASSK